MDYIAGGHACRVDAPAWRATASSVAPEMPIVLPTTSPRMTPHVTRCRQRLEPSSPVGYVDPGIGEREQGHHDECRPRVEAVFQPLDYGHRRLCLPRDACSQFRPTGLRRARSSASIKSRGEAWSHPRQQPEGDPGQRRVNVRLVQR